MKFSSLFWEEYDKMKYRKRWVAFKHNVNKNKTKCYIINTPEHGNLGDQAIALAQNEFFKNECSLEVVEITSREYMYWKKKLEKVIDAGDTILICGGGHIGTLWPNEDNTIIDILLRFSQNKMVILPQTAFWQGDAGNDRLNKLVGAINNCKDLTIMARERNSYDSLTKVIENKDSSIICVPDIVTYFNYTPNNEKQNQTILLCMRDDRERVSHNISKEKIAAMVNNEYDIHYTNTVVAGNIYREKREEKVQAKLEEFSNAKLVITDRLHGMVFSALAGTPCIAIDNVSKKVSGVYNWISYLDYIKVVESEDLINEDLIRQMISSGKGKYSNEALREYYHEMVECII